MMLVIASGVYGISVYATLPQELSDNRAEMTKPQMIDAVAKLDRQLQVAAQPLTVGDTEIVSLSLDDNVFGGGLIRRLSGRYPRCGTARALRELQQRRSEEHTSELQSLMRTSHALF